MFLIDQKNEKKVEASGKSTSKKVVAKKHVINNLEKRSKQKKKRPWLFFSFRFRSAVSVFAPSRTDGHRRRPCLASHQATRDGRGLGPEGRATKDFAFGFCWVSLVFLGLIFVCFSGSTPGPL